MIFEILTFGVKDFILDYCLKNIEDVVAKLHFENIEKVLSLPIAALGMFGETPLSSWPFEVP